MVVGRAQGRGTPRVGGGDQGGGGGEALRRLTGGVQRRTQDDDGVGALGGGFRGGDELDARRVQHVRAGLPRRRRLLPHGVAPD